MRAHQTDDAGLILQTIIVRTLQDRPNLYDASIGGGRGDSIINGVLVRAPVVVPVPAQVTMRQMRLALFDGGHMPAITTWFNGLSANAKARAQIEWDFGVDVRRDSGLFIQYLAPVLNLSEPDLDDLFRDAATM